MIIVSVGIHLIRLVPRHLPPEGKAEERNPLARMKSTKVDEVCVPQMKSGFVRLGSDANLCLHPGGSEAALSIAFP